MTKNKQYQDGALRNVRRAFPPETRDSAFDEGEEFICKNCDIPEKPCVEDAAYECPEKILGGTQLESARERFRLIMNGVSPRCESCGRKLSVRQMRREPLVELCPECLGRLRSPE